MFLLLLYTAVRLLYLPSVAFVRAHLTKCLSDFYENEASMMLPPVLMCLYTGWMKVTGVMIEGERRRK